MTTLQDSLRSADLRQPQNFFTSFLLAPFQTRYHAIRRTQGPDEARRVAEAQRAALESAEGRRVPAYLLTEKRRYVAELKNEAVAAREAGLDAQWIDEVPVPFATRGAILYPDAAVQGNVTLEGSDVQRMNALAFAIEGEHPAGMFRDTADQPHFFTWDDGLLVVVSEEPFEVLEAYARERFGSLDLRYRWEEEWRRERDSNPR